MEYSSPEPMSPTGSLLRGFRPSLHWLFHNIRGKDDRDFVTKDDLRVILRGEVDPNELDEAFDRLDKDGNGRITEDEFMNGFATFLVEASAAQNDDFDTNIGGHNFRRRSSMRCSRRKHDMLYEGQGDSVRKPSDEFKQSLKHLSLHNRLSIQDLWKSLNESNPDALGDFEEFVGEMASEVHTAQNALRKQKEVNRLDAIELDVEMAMIHDQSRAKLKEQSEILREKAETKIEQQLKEKDEELGEIRDKLQLLENELLASKHNQVELKHKYEESILEREMLLKRLTSSEKLLTDSSATIDTLKDESSKQKEEQQGYLQQHKESITELKMAYTSEIEDLKEQIKLLQLTTVPMYSAHNGNHGNISTSSGMVSQATPDLLSAHQELGRVSPSSLLDEIVESEGTISPVLKDTMIYTSSPLAITSKTAALEHLDLASKTSNTTDKKVILRSKKKRMVTSRPTSMYCDNIDNMDLDWPPGNWQETRQEWLAQVAASANITCSPTHLSPLKPQRSKKSHTPNNNDVQQSKPVNNKTIVVHTSKDQKKQTKYFNPEKCQPLEFVESFVVKPHQTFKILVVGNPHVGKSCFLMRLCTNTFTARYASTIGVDFFSRAILLNDKVISLQLWDTAGQERFQSVTRAYYRGANGVILMYDISREDSFIAVKTWINSIQDNMDEPPAGILLVGNKADLDESNQREVLTETGETFAKIYGGMFAEVSAKTGYNVGNACLLLVEKLIDELGYDDGSKSYGASMLKSSDKSKCSC